MELGTAQKLARKDWVEASRLTLSNPSEIYALLRNKINDNSALDRKSYVLLDLDSTLYEVGPRTARILRDALESPEIQVPVSIQKALLGLSEPGYSLEDTWEKLGLCLLNESGKAARDQLHEFWHERFFSNSYLESDVAYPGTAEFARELHALGAEVVYLTGRDSGGMREGTLKNLRRDGFPLGAGTHLRMKAKRETDDVDHKLGVARMLAQSGSVVASLENEPRNFAALFEALPEAIHVFVDTVCSNKPAQVVQGAYRLDRFVVATHSSV